jgi:hypothetical protein
MQEPGSRPSIEKPSAPIPNPTGGPAPQNWQQSPLLANDSGTGPTAVLPAELNGFNWGACLLSWIWAIGHQFWLGLIAIPVSFVAGFIPVIGMLVPIGIMVFFGLKGNEWAWQSRRWDSIQHFQETQKVWVKWGIIVAAVVIIFAVIIGVIAGMVIAASVARQ